MLPVCAVISEPRSLESSNHRILVFTAFVTLFTVISDEASNAPFGGVLYMGVCVEVFGCGTAEFDDGKETEGL